MKFKKYKINKLRYLLRKKRLMFFCSYQNTKVSNWKILEQMLIKNNLKCYKISNTILIKLLSKSIFKNIVPLINGPILLIYSDKIPKNFEYNNLQTLLNPNIKILCAKMNNKIYFNLQLNNILLTYNYNILRLTKLFNNINKKVVFKIKKLSINN